MNGIGSVAAVVLALVLGWAALVKLRRPAATRRQFAELRVPLPGVAAHAVPVVELLVAAALLLAPAWGGVAAFALLAAFTVVLWLEARSPSPAACGCFGAASDEPVSDAEVVRNLGLLALAVAAVLTERLVVPALPDVVLVTTALLLGLVVVQALRLRSELGTLWNVGLAGELSEEPA